MHSSDTDFTPFDTGAYASSTTYISGGAAKKAAEQARAQMLEVAGSLLKANPETRIIKDRIITAPSGRTVTASQVALHSLHAETQQQIMATASGMASESPPPCDGHDAQ